MSRTVSFNHDGWAYQLYLASLKARGREEPARVSRCEVLAGVLWMMQGILWRRTLGAEVAAGGYMPLWSLVVLGACATYVVGCAGFLVYLVVQTMSTSGIASAAGLAGTIVGFAAVTIAVLGGVIFMLSKIGLFRAIAALYRFCRETLHFLYELFHHAVEGSVLCPIVVVTNRPQAEKAK